ncbi:MAG: glycosyltransferase [Steroidobacteraceae bacterium]
MSQVDVILPWYNVPTAYVRDALQSIVKQTFRDWTAIVVNDGSSAGLTAELEALIQSLGDPRIRYVKSENRGVSAARNLGIATGEAPFVAFLDPDDLWYPHKLERQLDLLREDSEIALLHADTDYLHGDDLAGLERTKPRDLGLDGLSPAETWRKLLRKNFVCTNTAILRRSSGEQVGFFDANLRALEDKDLWIRMLMTGAKLRHASDVQAVYRRHGSNTSKNVDKMLAGRLDLVRKIDRLVADLPQWKDAGWPTVRKEMVRHAFEEVVETHLEAGRYAQALRYSTPRYLGVSAWATKKMLVAVAGITGLRRVH